MRGHERSSGSVGELEGGLGTERIEKKGLSMF